mmetsp:Transcript_8034/g.18987  ORF Transcript_8034/g.18987 Transcript_8034/m.18987 type:complete len:299 (-) Transcript_8034:595-1491(-)
MPTAHIAACRTPPTTLRCMFTIKYGPAAYGNTGPTSAPTVAHSARRARCRAVPNCFARSRATRSLAMLYFSPSRTNCTRASCKKKQSRPDSAKSWTSASHSTNKASKLEWTISFSAAFRQSAILVCQPSPSRTRFATELARCSRTLEAASTAAETLADGKGPLPSRTALSKSPQIDSASAIWNASFAAEPSKLRVSTTCVNKRSMWLQALGCSDLDCGRVSSTCCRSTAVALTKSGLNDSSGSVSNRLQAATSEAATGISSEAWRNSRASRARVGSPDARKRSSMADIAWPLASYWTG